MQKLLDAAFEEKHECEQKLAAAKRDVQSLMLQLQQKETEIERSRNLVRLFLLLLMVMTMMVAKNDFTFL